jgi:alcohol dehydrogenase
MEVSPFVFFRPPTIHFGTNSAARLGSIVSGYGTSVLWVHGAGSMSRPAVRDTVASGLAQAKVSILEWEIASEPSPADVDRAVAEFGSEKIDAVLSVGGGSVIDAGKAISAMLTLDKPVLDYCEGAGARQHPGTKLPFIAVPTTAGTGAEATCNAVLSDVGPGGFKGSLRHQNLMPDVAVVDPALSLSCPTHLASACGMDALAQLLESFVSTRASALTDALAASGLDHLKDNLVPSCTTRPDDVDIRSNVSYAALLSGIALANAGLGVVHGFASTIGGMFRIPHGVVCGTLLVPCMRHTIEKLIADNGPLHHIVKFAQAGEILCDRRGDTAEETCEMLIEKLSEYARALALPPFSSYGITSSSIAAIIEKTNNRNNPVILAGADLRAIVMEAMGL